MFEIDELHVSFGRVAAVRGISVTVEPGKVTLVLGANGAGKTTTLRAAAGLIKPLSGQVRLNGKVINGLPPHRIVAQGVALVPEGRRILGPLTVLENLHLGGHVVSRSELRANVERSFEMFPILAERRSSAAGLLSGGEQQMLAFARALMSNPAFVLMDEPSMGLAPTVIESVMAMVRSIADAGVGVLMVEQNAEMGLEVADNVVVVARGECVYSGAADETRSHSSIVRAFLGDAALTVND